MCACVRGCVARLCVCVFVCVFVCARAQVRVCMTYTWSYIARASASAGGGKTGFGCSITSPGGGESTRCRCQFVAFYHQVCAHTCTLHTHGYVHVHTCARARVVRICVSMPVRGIDLSHSLASLCRYITGESVRGLGTANTAFSKL